MKRQNSNENKTKLNKIIFLYFSYVFLFLAFVLALAVYILSEDLRHTEPDFLLSAVEKIEDGKSTTDAQWDTGIFVYRTKLNQAEKLHVSGFQNLDTPFVCGDGDWFCSAEQEMDDAFYLLQMHKNDVVRTFELPLKPQQIVCVNDTLFFVSNGTLFRLNLASLDIQTVRDGLTNEKNLFFRQALQSDGQRLIYSVGEEFLRSWFLYDPALQKERFIGKGKFCAGLLSDGSVLISSKKETEDLAQHLQRIDSSGRMHSFLGWKRFLWPKLLNDDFILESYADGWFDSAPVHSSLRLVSAKTGFTRKLPLKIKNGYAVCEPLEVFLWE